MFPSSFLYAKNVIIVAQKVRNVSSVWLCVAPKWWTGPLTGCCTLTGVINTSFYELSNFLYKIRQPFPELLQPACILCCTFHGGASENMPVVLRVCPCPTSRSSHVPYLMGTSHCSWVWARSGKVGLREWVQVVAGLVSCSGTPDVRCRILGMLQRQRGAFLSARSVLHAKGTVPERSRGKDSFL